MFDPELLTKICGRWNYKIMIDAFASRHNRQVKSYWSWTYEPEAKGQDAFLQDWSKVQGLYANPPWPIIDRVLTKIKEDHVPKMLLVVPVWTSAPWWPRFMEMVTKIKILHPKTRPYWSQDKTKMMSPKWRTAIAILKS
jgi:hypothetical protein